MSSLRIFITLLSFLSSVTLLSQNSFFREYDLKDDGNLVFFDAVEVDNKFVVCGIQNKHLSGVAKRNNATLIGLDNSGNKLWQKSFKEHYSENFDKILKVDNFLYVIGNKYDTLVFNKRRKFWKFSTQGDLINTKEFGDTVKGWWDNVIYSFTKDKDGLLVAGSGSSDDVTGTDGELLKLDYEGNIVWQKRYTYDLVSPRTTDLIKGVKAEEDGYILFMESLVNDTPNHHEHIIKVDKEGNELWRKNVTNYQVPAQLSLPNMLNTAAAVVPYQEGYVLFVQARDEYERSFRTYKVRLDKQGNEVDITSCLDSIDYELFNLYVTENEELVLAGRDMTVYPDEWAWKHLFIKWDNEGNLIAKNRNGSPNEEIINWFINGKLTQDGGFLSVGYIFRVGTFGPRDTGIICKTDCMGNSIWDYSSCSIERENNTVTVFPNPSNGRFLFHTAARNKISYWIYDYLGRLVEEKTLNDTAVFEVNLSEHANGVYHYKVQLNNNESITGKVLKQ